MNTWTLKVSLLGWSIKRSVGIFNPTTASAGLEKLNGDFLLKRHMLEEKKVYNKNYLLLYLSKVQSHKVQKARRRKEQDVSSQRRGHSAGSDKALSPVQLQITQGGRNSSCTCESIIC